MAALPPTRRPSGSKPMASVLEHNIRSLHDRFLEHEREQSLQERIGNAIGRFTGSMPFVYIHLAAVVCWVAINAGWTPLTRFDPSFIILATCGSVEAIFLSTFVLINQNRMARRSERRADLDLQISLLTEHEVTRMIHLLSEIAERLNLDASSHQDLRELKEDVDPTDVLDRIDETQQDGLDRS